MTSQHTSDSTGTSLDRLAREYCGDWISAPDQECPARDDGRCRP